MYHAPFHCNITTDELRVKKFRKNAYHSLQQLIRSFYIPTNKSNHARTLFILALFSFSSPKAKQSYLHTCPPSTIKRNTRYTVEGSQYHHRGGFLPRHDAKKRDFSR